MKYLKKFESIFGAAEPELIPGNEWIEKIKSLGKAFFSKSEHKTLIDLMEKSGRESVVKEEEWDNLHWDQKKIEKFHIGLTYLSFYIESGDDNPNPYGVDITKCKDEWFLVSFYQEGWDDFDEYEEYYECDGFDCLLDLLKKEAKLG